jgi:hypothetical protein
MGVRLKVRVPLRHLHRLMPEQRLDVVQRHPVLHSHEAAVCRSACGEYRGTSSTFP